ncbi:hypothetical protein ACLOJK_020915 [Asimina triloba]
MRNPNYYAGVVVIVVAVPLLVYVLDPATPPLFPSSPLTPPAISHLYVGSARHVTHDQEDYLRVSLDGVAGQASLSLYPDPPPSASYSTPQAGDENLLLPVRFLDY